MIARAGSTIARASSGSRSSIWPIEVLMSATSTVTVLRSPSGASGEVPLRRDVHARGQSWRGRSCGCCARTIPKWSATLAAEVGCGRVFRLTFYAVFGERIAALRAEVIDRGIIRSALRAAHRLFLSERSPSLLSPASASLALHAPLHRGLLLLAR